MRALIALCVAAAAIAVGPAAQAGGASPQAPEKASRVVTQQRPVRLPRTGAGREVIPVVADNFENSQRRQPLVSTSDGLRRATSGEISRGRAATSRARVSATPLAQRAYVAIVDNSGTTADDATIDSEVDNALAWWTAQSGGAITTFTRAAGVRYDSDLSGEDRCGLGDNPEDLWNEASDEFPSVDFDDAGNHLVVVVSQDCADEFGGTVGIGTVGDSLATGGWTTVTDEADIFQTTLDHELGHNFGLEHGVLEHCDDSGCEDDEYYDLYSVMGLAVPSADPYAPPALDSAERIQLGITGSGEVQRVGGGEIVTATLRPRSDTAGLRGLELVAGYTTYWIDYRSGTGVDTNTYYAKDGANLIEDGDLRADYPAGVTVEEQNTDAAELPGGYGYRQVYLETQDGHGALGTGTTFKDAAIKVHVDSIDESTRRATVTITATPQFTGQDPTISGTAAVGRTLTARTGSWSPTPTFSYQWYVGADTKIRGATKRSLTLTAAQKGKVVWVLVTARRSGYLTDVRWSPDSAKVRVGTLATSRPTIAGKVKVGRTLTAKPGHWTGGTRLAYRWYANGKAIAKATHKKVKLAKKVKGKHITVKVTGTKNGYTKASRISHRTGAVKK